MPDQTTNAGVMPVAGGEMPPQTDPATAAPKPSEMDAPEAQDVESLRRALAAERKRADANDKLARQAQARLGEVEAASKSETEKLIDAARKEGATEAVSKANERIRRSEVRAALTTAGVNPALLDLAARHDDFAALPVDDEGNVKGLAEAVEAVKKAMPDLFKVAQRPDYGGGNRGGTPQTPPGMNELLKAAARNR